MGEVQVSTRRGYRSIFLPLLLIGVGSVWLLVNMGIFRFENIAVLARLWPLLLIAGGLDLLFGRRSRTLGAFIGIGAVLGMLALILVGPSIGLVSLPELQAAQFDEVIGDAQSAQITIDSGVNTVEVTDLPDSRNLFMADVQYYGEIEFEAAGNSEKTIRLSQLDSSISGGIASFFISVFGGEAQAEERETDWNIGLAPNLPTHLDIDTGVGSTNLDLSNIELTGLTIDAGVGKVEMTLPITETGYSVTIDGGVGEISISLPEGMAVRLDASIGVGSVDLPPTFRRVDGDEDNIVGDDGVWETEGFQTASNKVIISFDGGVGSLKVR